MTIKCNFNFYVRKINIFFRKKHHNYKINDVFNVKKCKK